MKLWLLPCILGPLLLPACTRHKIELDVKPIHITLDVNIRVQRELGDIFDEIEGEPAKTPKPETKAPKGS